MYNFQACPTGFFLLPSLAKFFTLSQPNLGMPTQKNEITFLSKNTHFQVHYPLILVLSKGLDRFTALLKAA